MPQRGGGPAQGRATDSYNAWANSGWANSTSPSSCTGPGPKRGNDPESIATEAPKKEAQQRQGVRVGPMEVIDEQQQRARLAKVLDRTAAPLVKAGAGLRRAEAGDGIQFAERCQRLAQEAKREGRRPLPPQPTPGRARRPPPWRERQGSSCPIPHEEQGRVLAAPCCLDGSSDGGERRFSLQQRNF